MKIYCQCNDKWSWECNLNGQNINIKKKEKN